MARKKRKKYANIEQVISMVDRREGGTDHNSATFTITDLASKKLFGKSTPLSKPVVIPMHIVHMVDCVMKGKAQLEQMLSTYNIPLPKELK